MQQDLTEEQAERFAEYCRWRQNLADLMHDFFCADPAQMRIKELARAVQHFKTSEEGIRKMSGVFEEVWQEGYDEGMREAARRMLRIGGLTVEVVARITGLDEGEVQRLGAEAQSSPA